MNITCDIAAIASAIIDAADLFVSASHKVTSTASLALETVTTVPAYTDAIASLPFKNTSSDL